MCVLYNLDKTSNNQCVKANIPSLLGKLTGSKVSQRADVSVVIYRNIDRISCSHIRIAPTLTIFKSILFCCS